MDKIILSGSFAFNDATAAIVPLHKMAVDKQWMHKRAASQVFDFSKYEPKKGETLVHLLALGDLEKYSANRNGDGFRADVNEKYHPTFRTGHYFHHHMNKDAALAKGRVLDSAYNPDMGRVELIVGLDNTKCAEDLGELEQHGEFPVSMSCTTDPSTPVLTERGYIPIAEVKIGDLVVTHTGDWRRVTQVMKRQYTGEVIEFRPRGLPRQFSVTADHPFVAMKHEMWELAVKGHGRADHVSLTAQQTSWMHAEHFEDRDRISGIIPKPHPTAMTIDDPQLAALMGYYLAEGSLGYNRSNGIITRPCTVNFCVNVRDSAYTRIPDLVHALWDGVTVTLRAHSSSAVCFNVAIHSSDFAEFINDALGVYSHHKHIPWGIYNAPADTKLAFLGAWLDGDGFVDKKGAHWSTVSENLALQGRDLLASIGASASIYKIDHTGQPGYKGKGPEYTLNLSHCDSAVLKPWSQKMTQSQWEAPVTAKPPAYRVISATQALLAVTRLSRRHVEDTWVYNIEVEEEHSYSMAGMASHNCRVSHDICSICGNKAKSRAEYCKHASTMMGRILDDGRQVYVDNPDPHFFDISRVFRPADRVAYTFRKFAKAASEERVMGGAELADMLNQGLALSGRMSPYAAQKEALLQKAAALAAVTGGNMLPAAPLPDVALEALKSAELSAALGQLHRAGVCLPVDAFLQISGLAKSAAVKASDITKRIQGLLSGPLDSATTKRMAANASYDGAMRPVSSKTASAVAQLRPGYSMLPEYAIPRSIKQAAAGLPQWDKSASASSPEADVLAEEYGAYLLSFARAAGEHNPAARGFVENLTLAHTRQ